MPIQEVIAPFSGVVDARDFAAQAPVKTNYRIVAACYQDLLMMA